MEQVEWKKGSNYFGDCPRWLKEIGKQTWLARKKGGNVLIDFPTKKSRICGIHVCLHLIYEL